MNIGLYFGTFNPIHVGHLVIANYMADFTDLDQVWLIVTPQNPLKKKRTLLKDVHRLLLVKEAINDNFKLKASDIEFNLPKPSYTIKTLNKLIEKYPKNNYSLIMGEDNSIHKVTPKANRMITFNGKHLHTGHSPQHHKCRILINANYSLNG